VGLVVEVEVTLPVEVVDSLEDEEDVVAVLIVGWEDVAAVVDVVECRVAGEAGISPCKDCRKSRDQHMSFLQSIHPRDNSAEGPGFTSATLDLGSQKIH